MERNHTNENPLERIANTSTKTAVISALAIATSRLAEAGYVVQNPDITPNREVQSGGYAVIDFNITNNDSGAIYNSGGIVPEIFGDLATQLYGIEANQNAYASIEELMGAWSLNIRSPPTGEVYNGWNNTLNSEGGVSLNHAPFGYDQWSSSGSSNMMALTLRIPLSQLELDGITGYNPQTDARIELSDTVVNNAFVGQEGAGGGLSFYAPMQQYQVVPEPMTALLFGLGTLGIIAKRGVDKAKSYFTKE